MMSREILKKLRELRLNGFADEYNRQLSQDIEYGNMGFTERLMLLVDAEFDSQCNNRMKRLLKNAKLPDSTTCLSNQNNIASKFYVVICFPRFNIGTI